MRLKENKSLASWLKTKYNKVEFPTCMPVFFRGFQVQEVKILSHLSNVDALEHFLYFFTRSDHNKLYLNKATGCLADRGIPRLLCAQCHHTSPLDYIQHSYSSTRKTTFSERMEEYYTIHSRIIQGNCQQLPNKVLLLLNSINQQCELRCFCCEKWKFCRTSDIWLLLYKT